MPNQPDCTGNCVNVNISGSTFIKTSNTPLPNVAVEVTWVPRRLCLFCSRLQVASGKTNNDGKFNFNAAIDSSFFKDFSLRVRIPVDTNYFSGKYTNEEYIEEEFYEFNPNLLQDIKFEFYTKAPLTIRLHRTLSDDFTYFSVDHTFISTLGFSDYTIYAPKFAKDTTVNVVTSPNVYTKIHWRKNFISGQYDIQSDSLLCTSNGPNVFDLNY